MNQAIRERLEGIQRALTALHAGGSLMSSASKGTEREYFVRQFLAQVFPPTFRFGSGDIIDTGGSASSGQVDVVIEFPYFPSLPLFGADPRIYLAEGVSVAIEVKSNLKDQWAEVCAKGEKIKELQRDYSGIVPMEHEGPASQVPVVAVGFTGWRNAKTLRDHVEKAPGVDLALIIDKNLFAGETREWRGSTIHKNVEHGENGLAHVIRFLHHEVSQVFTGDLAAMRGYFG